MKKKPPARGNGEKKKGNGHARGHRAAPEATPADEAPRPKALPAPRGLVPRERALVRSQVTLVTGGTGFLGAHLLEQLVAVGGRLRVVTTGAPGWLKELGVEIVEGSLTSPDVCARAVTGVQRIFHLAGKVSRDPDQKRAMYEVHVDGTRTLLEAAAQKGVARVVLASTSGTIAVSADAQSVPDETAPPPMDLIARWPYYASKAYQEHVAQEICARAGIELVTLHPSLLLGPGDARLSSTEDVLRFLGKKIPTLPSGGLSFVDARDCASAFIAAMEQGRAGERYLIGSYNYTFADFFARLERLSGISAPRWKLPTKWVKPAARLMEALYDKLGKAAPVDAESAEMGEYFWYLDSTKARTELGFVPRDPTETLADTISYIRKRFLPRDEAFSSASTS
jgi:dihydroflavonol-4-reductase